MNQYLLIIGWLALCFLYTLVFKPFYEEDVYGVKVRKIKWLPALIMMLPLIYWAGFRPSGVFDTGQYVRTFHTLPNSVSGALSSWSSWNKDPAYYVFASLIRTFFGDDTRIYFTIIASIQGLILYWFFRKYSSDYWFSLFIFVASTDYLSWMHNGIRQFLAVTIILLATSFIIEKKFLWAIIFIGIASLFHASALLMLPLIFVVQGRAWNYRSVLLLGGVVIVYFFVERFTDVIKYLLEDTQYSDVVDEWISFEDNGTNPLRVLVYSIPMILSLVGLRFVKAEQSPLINVCVNFSIATTGLYLVSMFTSGIFIGRLPIFTSLFATGILLPWEIDHIFEGESAKAVKIIAIVAYLGFYYYQCHMIWHLF